MKRFIFSNYALIMFVLSGCVSQHNMQDKIELNRQNEESFDPSKHVISIDPDGKLNPCKGGDDDEYKNCESAYFQKIIAEIDDFQKITASKESGVLLFVHGGLNSEKDALERAKRTSSIIMKDTQHPMYPVFITWQSGGLETYKDHLWSIRQGDENQFAKWTSPIYLLTDIGNSIINAPKSWLVSGEHLIDSTDDSISKKTEEIEKQIDEIKNKKECFNISYTPTNDDKNDNQKLQWFGNPNKSGRSLRWLLTSPAKAITTPFTYTMAKPAWDIMLRRTETLFYSPCKDLDDKDACKKQKSKKIIEHADFMPERAMSAYVTELNSGSGALSVFLQDLEENLNKWQNTMPDIKTKITLVGHSMGAIVVDKIILQKPNLPYKNIVHLASADSVNNVFNIIIPYIDYSIQEEEDRCQMPKDSPECKEWAQKQAVQFYSLMLHPDNEDREAAWQGLVPSGSLLTWIDEMYTSPQTVMDRRSGRWENIRKVIQFIPERIAKNMHFKIFGTDKNECEKGKECLIPQQHGHFDEIPFWREDTWK